MPGQATVTIRDKQWSVSIANTPAELMQGLGGIPQIPASTGMLFDTGWEQYITVTTEGMLFPLDIAFLSESLVVVDLVQHFIAGYRITSVRPARYFLEVNAGEMDGIDLGDQASVELHPLQEVPIMSDWTATIFSLMGFALMGAFMVATAKPVLEALFEEPGEVTLLPSTEKSEPMDLAAKILASLKGKGPEYRAYVRYPRDKSAFVTIGSIIGGHYSWNPQGFTVWVDAWEKDPRYPPDSILAIRELRSGRSFLATEEGVRMALDYVQREFPTFTESRWVSRSVPIYVAGELGILKPEFLPQVEHGSPQLTEEHLRKMRQLLGLTADVAEILRTHRRTGYIP